MRDLEDNIFRSGKIEGLEDAVSILRGCQEAGRQARLEIEHHLKEMKRKTEEDRIVIKRVRVIDGQEVATLIDAFVINDSFDEAAAATWAAGMVAKMRDQLEKNPEARCDSR